jgi:hypothetical protein
MAKRKSAAIEAVTTPEPAPPADAHCRIGENGRILVDNPANKDEPLVASKVYVIASPNDEPGAGPTDVVTLLVESRRAAQDVEKLLDGTFARLSAADGARAPQKTLKINGDDELVLSCGKSSITLTKSGKVIIRGTKIVSHASGDHKIRGAQISLN